jgi:hypothetical protein
MEVAAEQISFAVFCDFLNFAKKYRNQPHSA